MGDERTLPPPPSSPLLGDEAEGPRTNRGRPAMPSGVVLAPGAPIASAPPSAPRSQGMPSGAPRPVPSPRHSPVLDQELLFDEDDLSGRDAGTPIPGTFRSALLEGGSFSGPSTTEPIVRMPAVASEMDATPLPPPAIIEAGLSVSNEGDAEPISSSRPPTSIAPAMPQIPRPVSYRPAALAPGIVSTQPIPLTSPAKSNLRAPILVAVAAALIGGTIALFVLLLVRSKAKDEPSLSAQAAASTASAEASPSGAPALTSAPVSATAPESTAAPASTTAPESNTAAPANVADAPSSTSARAPSQALTAPPSRPRPGRASTKSDRIED